MPFAFISWDCSHASHPWKEQGRKCPCQSSSTGHIGFPCFPYPIKPQGLLTPLLLPHPLVSLLKDPTLPKKKRCFLGQHMSAMGCLVQARVGKASALSPPEGEHCCQQWTASPAATRALHPEAGTTARGGELHFPGVVNFISQEWQLQPWVLHTSSYCSLRTPKLSFALEILYSNPQPITLLFRPVSPGLLQISCWLRNDFT